MPQPVPFFSTIIPSYNRRDLIVATLDSVLNQEYDDNEVIVVDDGSTDGTMRVLETYAKHIKVLTQNNAGPGAARNRGVAEASGVYVAFLDSDDLWFPWTLAEFRRAIESYRQPAIVTSIPTYFTGHPPAMPPRPENIEETHYACFYQSPRQWHLPSGTVVRRDLFLNRGGFAETAAEDVDAWLRWGSLPGMVSIVKPNMFAYRIHADGICKTNRYRYDGIRRIVAMEKAGNYKDVPEFTAARRDYIATNVRATSFYCLGRRKFAWAWNLYMQTFMWHAQMGRVKYLLGFPAVSLWEAAQMIFGTRHG